MPVGGKSRILPASVISSGWPFSSIHWQAVAARGWSARFGIRSAT
jgi:hypothetical protein